MNSKNVFLKELASYLHKMKEEERDKYITYYDELISDYIEDGMTEEEAVIKIGDPQKVSKELLENYESISINMPLTGNRALNMILIILGFKI